ncbi:MAG: AEC family transporter [Alphaproteobacteria bacterium]|nr:AEC family transporter [Alphaproteobacteria bacterium]
MASFLAIFGATFPFFAVVALGAVGAWRGLLGQAAAQGVTVFVFYFALPCLIFRAFALRDLGEVLRWDYLIAYGAATLAVYLAALAAGRFLFRLNLGETALHGQAAAVSNAGFLGIPLIAGIMGPAATAPVVIAILWDLVVTITCSLVLLELHRARQGEGGSLARAVAQAARGVLGNPFILSIAAGIAWSATGWSLPAPAGRLTGLLADAAGPAALFALGASLVGRPLSEGLGEVASMSLFKLLLHPLAVALVCFQLYPIDPFWAAAGVLTAALPVAANVFVIGGRYGLYVARGSTAILISTAVAVFSVPAAIALLGLG